jgi:hypothetical protein
MKKFIISTSIILGFIGCSLPIYDNHFNAKNDLQMVMRAFKTSLYDCQPQKSILEEDEEKRQMALHFVQILQTNDLTQKKIKKFLSLLQIH